MSRLSEDTPKNAAKSQKDLIKCPDCGAKFAVTDAVESGLRDAIKEEYRVEAADLRKRVEAERQQLESKQSELDSARRDIDAEVSRRMESGKKRIEESARAVADTEIEAIKKEMQEQSDRLAEAQKNEIELRRQQRSLEQERAEFNLKFTREMDAERSKIVEETSRKVSDEYASKQLDWERQKADLIKQADELKRKADQGSQQAQGENLEIEIEAILHEAFPLDEVNPVAKGVKGGDILQVIKTKTGERAGAILWEIKKTKSWSDSWPQKLKDDQRDAKADLSIIVTAAMPKGVERLGQYDGVWVSEYKSMIGAALALRQAILEVAQARKSQAGRKTKAEDTYDYLNGPEFRGRIQALVETFVAMKEDLDAERRTFDKVWAKREKQLVRVVGSMAGMYGDLQGLIGSSLPEIPALTVGE